MIDKARPMLEYVIKGWASGRLKAGEVAQNSRMQSSKRSSAIEQKACLQPAEKVSITVTDSKARNGRPGLHEL
jgi:hypothetical protein